MYSHFADVDVWVGNLESEGEGDELASIIESALASAGFKATATVTVSAYPEKP